ncbi:MAG: radical SAM family heme chaperone HemW [Gemmatimonadaceae bacterium]|nr:radical SAM family heme chaperone HemW [Gemmatimonadaceae bacterium]
MTAPSRHVYVHVPFCARRCSYCDFNIAVRREVPVREYLDALEAELTARLPDHRHHRIETLYFGGGTPSHLGKDGLAAAVGLLGEFFQWDADAEVTVEANPDDITPLALATWKAGGVTRLSLGAQSFDPHVLAWMHRSHTAEQVLTAVDHIREVGFTSWSFDLIFALPASLQRDWARDLDLALGTDPPHLSLYGLTIEPGTPLGRWAERGEVAAADEGTYEHQFLSAHAAATAAGLEHYEVSNFGRPGHQARHNRCYWSGAPYLAFGPGAHGFDGTTRRWNHGPYARWRDTAMRGVDPVAGQETIGSEARGLEAAYLGLRTTDGLRLDAAGRAVAAPWIAAGWAVLSGDRLVLTPTGWLRLDTLANAITPASAHT